MGAGRTKKHSLALLRIAGKNRNAALLKIQPGTGCIAAYTLLPARITDPAIAGCRKAIYAPKGREAHWLVRN
ncbi:MAG: hypothetical protein A2010_09775 [Nitrospirae bacterium GWD2_57_9]|nr:MAG: hypothetical protein A2010_09775 [Nitrospirae bacterium GWD2_57_9]